jgi:hypothetical protein
MAVLRGTKLVTFQYRPPKLSIGVGLGIAALLILLGDAAVLFRRRRRVGIDSDPEAHAA